MNVATLAHLQSVYLGLTLAQRRHLEVIVEAESQSLSDPVCKDLIDLALVSRDGDALRATEAGRYVAALLAGTHVH